MDTSNRAAGSAVAAGSGADKFDAFTVFPAGQTQTGECHRAETELLNSNGWAARQIPMHLKKILFTIITAFIMGCVPPPDHEQVGCIIKGKPVLLTPEARTNLVEQSVGLLASCAYMDAKPKWGAPTEPKSITDAQKESHLYFTFASPRTVEVPVLKTKVRVREMVISLPLAVGGIWARTDEGVSYFAMFEYTNTLAINKLLKEAQIP